MVGRGGGGQRVVGRGGGGQNSPVDKITHYLTFYGDWVRVSPVGQHEAPPYLFW